MQTAIVIAGFGGQGVLYAGKLLAYAGMDNGFHVTWIPSYGPEMRGGTANCTVIIGDEPIGAPLVAHPDVVLALNQPSYQKFEPLVRPGGLLVVNSSLVTEETARYDIDFVPVRLSEMAEAAGSTRALNVAGIAAVLANWLILPLEAVDQALVDHPPARDPAVVALNRKILRQVFDQERALTADFAF